MKIEFKELFLILSAIGCIIFSLILYLYFDNKRSVSKNPELKKGQFGQLKNGEFGPLTICPECKGTGEKIQDVNEMMMLAKCAIWMNSHTAGSEGCKDCNNNSQGLWEHCEKAKAAMEKFVEEYEKSGPKMSKAACPGCMGMGSYQVWIYKQPLN